MADARKKNKAEEVRWKHEKEKEIARRMKAGENRSEVESELELEDPTEVGDDMNFFEEEESREVVASSVEHRNPTAAAAGGEQEAERRGNVPVARKCAASTNIVGE